MTRYDFTIPTLETERLRLRGWREDDLDGLAQIYADDEYTQYIGGGMPRYDVWRVICQRIGQWAVRGYAMMVMEEKATGAFAGYCGPHYPEGWPEPEIGWTLHPKHQGKGYATEGARVTLKYAYEVLGWKTAMSLVDANNTASRAVALRLGATYERTEKVTDFTADIYRHLPPNEFLNLIS